MKRRIMPWVDESLYSDLVAFREANGLHSDGRAAVELIKRGLETIAQATEPTMIANDISLGGDRIIALEQKFERLSEQLVALRNHVDRCSQSVGSSQVAMASNLESPTDPLQIAASIATSNLESPTDPLPIAASIVTPNLESPTDPLPIAASIVTVEVEDKPFSTDLLPFGFEDTDPAAQWNGDRYDWSRASVEELSENCPEFWAAMLNRAMRYAANKNKSIDPVGLALAKVQGDGKRYWHEFKGRELSWLPNCGDYQSMVSKQYDLTNAQLSIESNWMRLGMTWTDSRLEKWLQKANRVDSTVPLEIKNLIELPEWAVLKLADDLERTGG
ncbi:MAG: hypothetical protein ACKO24_01320 [Leptolyngbyaceae cyanobacterium]